MSSAINAIAVAKLSGAIKPRGEKETRESLEKKLEKPQISSVEELMQEFIKWAQEHQPTGGSAADNNKGNARQENVATGTAGSETATSYDNAVKEVEETKNAPPEKKSLAKQFLEALKENRPYITTVAMEFLRKFLLST